MDHDKIPCSELGLKLTKQQLHDCEHGQYELFANLAAMQRPGLLKRAKSVTKAATRVVKSKAQNKAVLVDLTILNARKEACRTCPKLDGKWCGVCGCRLSAKQRLKTETCPLERWPE